MRNRVEDILAGLGDGKGSASLGGADAESVGLEPGSYTAAEIKKALASSEAKPETESKAAGGKSGGKAGGK